MESYRLTLIEAIQKLNLDLISEAGHVLFNAWHRKKNVWVFGNGHSASLAEAFAADLQKWPIHHSPIAHAIRAFALTSLPLMSAYANDADYDRCFSLPLSRVKQDGDVVIGITCGGSRNVFRAFNIAGASQRILITSTWAKEYKERAALKIAVDAEDIRQVEDAHSMICHMIVEAVTKEIKQFAAVS